MMKQLSFYIGLSLFILVLACSPAKRAFKKGDKKLKNGEFNLAIDYFEKAASKSYNEAEANFKIAESYRLSNRIKKALPYYEQAINKSIDEDEAKFFYGFALKSNGKYKESRKHFEQYLEVGSDPDYLEWAQRELDNLDILDKITDKEDFYRVKNLEEINTPAAEYGPVYNNGFLYFSSSREGGKIYKATGTPFTNLYRVVSRGAIVDLSTLQMLDGTINDPDTHEGSMTFTSDGRTMVFAKGNTGRRKGAEDVNLYITTFRNGQWTEPRLLGINDPNAWDSTPAFSKDGRTLYFASNRKGGYGGTDIYAATRDARGQFGNVRNLGPSINTPGNEMFPFVSDDARLFFSSTGLPGFGGLDIFVATRKQGKISVENLGPSINSQADDFSIFLFSPTKGFFASNREGGVGDDDIYTFVNNDPDLKIINYFLAGVTYEVLDDGEKEILPFTKVKLLDQNGELMDEATTARDGKYRFRVYPEEDYNLVAEKQDYFTSRIEFTTVGKSLDPRTLEEFETNKVFKQDIDLEQIVIDKAIVLDNIYYDFDKAEIRDDAAVELDRLVTILKDNPTIIIELSSHTDDRGSTDYNIRLSQRRAESAVNYIISKGIDKKRISAKGYGKTRPIIENAETEEEHQINRRTEFKVTEYEREGREDSFDDFDFDETDRFFEN